MYRNIYPREDYLQKVRGFYHDDLIKVISGIRRCGKSSLMKSISNELEVGGINPKDLIYIDLNKRGYRSITTPNQLDVCIDSKIIDYDFKYIFIDEIQNVIGFEGVINAFREEGNCSIFITGSNSYLLSGELATKLTGRYIEIEMFTLTFNEYLAMRKFFKKSIDENISREFENYLRLGGFPKAIEYDRIEDKELYVREVVNQIIQKDVYKHYKVKNRYVFEHVMNYVINNFGATTNLKNIQNYLKQSENISVKTTTINTYLDLLERAKIIYRCPRFDLKSKRLLSSEQKYYLSDLSIYYAMNVDDRINYGPVLENILFCYLSSKGYKLSVGKIGRLECDFITRKSQDYAYIQVALTILASKETEDREYRAFENIKDNYPKYLFTLDPLIQHRNGIIHKNLVDFITKNELL